MSQAKAAKDALLQAITTFQFSKAAVTNALNAEHVNKRLLATKRKNFEEALAMINAEHTTWVTKAELTTQQ